MKNTITGLVGAGGIEIVNQVTENVGEIQEKGSLILQLIIGIITLFKLLKKQQNEKF